MTVNQFIINKVLSKNNGPSRKNNELHINFNLLYRVCVYGGGDRKTQVDIVTRGVDIVIATPGRMNDLNEAGA